MRGQVDQQGVDVLMEHRDVWAVKPTLARLYRDEFFSRLDAWAPPGRVVEVGSGPGFFKEHRPDVISLDIVAAPWLDVTADGHALPIRDNGADAIVGVDVIHHLKDPVRFLVEAERALRPGGRLVIVEPWHTPFSRFVYTYLHEEDYDLSWSPEGARSATGDRPFEGNQAIPFLVFERYWPRLAQHVPSLTLLRREPFSFFAYLLTCGFRRPNLLPSPLYDEILWLERRTIRAWRRLAALRCLIVVERR